jgi:hypothetical protein
MVQQINISKTVGRPSVNNTTLDFYYVPKLENPNYFMTLDPAITADWERNTKFASLTVTFGRMLGSAFGGNGQVYIRPQILAGGDRPAKWSL